MIWRNGNCHSALKHIAISCICMSAIVSEYYLCLWLLFIYVWIWATWKMITYSTDSVHVCIHINHYARGLAGSVLKHNPTTAAQYIVKPLFIKDCSALFLPNTFESFKRFMKQDESLLNGLSIIRCLGKNGIAQWSAPWLLRRFLAFFGLIASYKKWLSTWL